MTTKEEVQRDLEVLLNALCLNFPFEGKIRAYGSAFCELLEEHKLAIMEETERDSFDEEEYGKYVWRLTAEGQKRAALTAQIEAPDEEEVRKAVEYLQQRKDGERFSPNCLKHLKTLIRAATARQDDVTTVCEVITTC